MICSFYLSVAARKLFKQIRPFDTLCMLPELEAIKKQTAFKSCAAPFWILSGVWLVSLYICLSPKGQDSQCFTGELSIGWFHIMPCRGCLISLRLPDCYFFLNTLLAEPVQLSYLPCIHGQPVPVSFRSERNVQDDDCLPCIHGQPIPVSFHIERNVQDDDYLPSIHGQPIPVSFRSERNVQDDDCLPLVSS